MNIKLLALSFSKALTPKSLNQFLTKYGSWDNIVLQNDKELSQHTRLSVNRTFEGWSTLLTLAEKIKKRADACNISITDICSPDYPKRLKQIYNPPFILYHKGYLPKSFKETEHKEHIGVVGTRNSDNYSNQFTINFCMEAAEQGCHIISGLATGIDTNAHRASYKNGHTTAVLGSGVNYIYPNANKKLYTDILDEGGTVISEHPPDTRPLAFHFPLRNRIISGLSDFILVVQAPKRSGTLITVKFALDQNRDILVFDANTEKESYLGNKVLINDGATKIKSFNDFLTLTNRQPDKKRNNITTELSATENKIIGSAKMGPTSLTEIAKATLLSVDKIMGTVFALVTKGFLTEMPGQKYFTTMGTIHNDIRKKNN